ncbi:glycosyltransferase [Ferruginibacter paludis]|uniref:glycosyltransferase n=1 Tax=Ferruginibacter paludis TaxID=1310417 RepID=UPI0025B4D768|nr:glycosyltransferase [Ferruginibacter paludis]MDN3656725.1 glycosyltransferase [Ferruginibacter paludis]
MLVNICMITYNHQQYIRQSIEAVLSQVTNFDFQLVIGEDNSTDCTKEICLEFAERYPDKIKLITSAINVGMSKNFFRTYKACEGKYIAFCEGDDYWTDVHKLQKQIEFLEANPDYCACFHNVQMKEERTGTLGAERTSESDNWVLHKSLPKDSFDTNDLLGPWFIPSLSVVFVNYPDFELPGWFHNSPFGDLPFMLLLSLRGNFKYLDEVMGVYRIHDSGATAAHKAYDKIMAMVYIYASFDIHTNYKFHEAIRKGVAYEIDRHIPPREITQPPVAPKISMLRRLYNRHVK